MSPAQDPDGGPDERARAVRAATSRVRPLLRMADICVQDAAAGAREELRDANVREARELLVQALRLLDDVA